MAWSYNVGQRGKGNWVRAYEDPRRKNTLFLEYFDENKKRTREKVAGPGEYRRAEDKARELSDRFTRGTNQLTMHRLIDDFLKEVTRNPEVKRSDSKRSHDECCARLWKASLTKDQIPEVMDRTQWDAFINARRAGAFEGFLPVGNRQIAYDLKFLIAVLGWSVGTSRISKHPWSADVRRTQKWTLPRNPTPRRPAMTDQYRSMLIKHSPNWRFALALELARETVSRNVSVRQLQWLDIDFNEEMVQWRNEKNEWVLSTPLTARAVALLKAAPRGIGEAWVFPSVNDAKKPCSRWAMQQWLKRAKKRLLASIEDLAERESMRAQLKGLGFHGEKRAAIRDPRFRELPPKLQETLARTRYTTIRDVYDEVGVDEMRAAVRRIS